MLDTIPSVQVVQRVKYKTEQIKNFEEDVKPGVEAPRIHLEDLAGHREQLGRDIEFVNAFIAPIRKLPTETLSTIFEYCALQDDNAPLTLQRVCRRWMTAAASPRVWSRVVIDLDELKLYTEKKTELYLEKSRSALLDIEIIRPGFTDYGWGAWYQVLAHSKRWQTLEIRAETYDQVNDILEELPEIAPNLIHTTFVISGLYFVDPSTFLEFPALELPPDLVKYPKFRSMRLHTWALPVLTLNPDQMFSQLTTLHLTDTYSNVFQSASRIRPHPICGNAISGILRQCPCLETFTLDAHNSVSHHSGRVCVDPSGAIRGEFTMSSLKNLSLVGHHLDILAILDRLVLPTLQIARIHPLPQWSAGLPEKFSDTWRGLIRRSRAPPLEDLDIRALSTTDVVWTMERSPRMKCFRLSYCSNPAPIIKALSSPYPYKGRGRYRPEPRWVCPKLSRIYFDECFSVTWSGVARLLQNRHKAHLEGKNLALTVDLIINDHDVLEDHDLRNLAYFKVRQIKTLIEP